MSEVGPPKTLGNQGRSYGVGLCTGLWVNQLFVAETDAEEI